MPRHPTRDPLSPGGGEDEGEGGLRVWTRGLVIVALVGALVPIACGRASSTRERAAAAPAQATPSARAAPEPGRPTVAVVPQPVARARQAAPQRSSAGRAAPRPAARRVSPAPAWRVRTVLVSADRRLALIDGHIVGPGDRLDGVTVVDIAADGVVIEDGAGRRYRLAAGVVARGVVVR
jgi:hypothetical protein